MKQQLINITLFCNSQTGDLSFVQVKHQHVRYLFEFTIILDLDSFKTRTWSNRFCFSPNNLLMLSCASFRNNL